MKNTKRQKPIAKKILIAAILMAALYLIYIFVTYWDIATEAFMAGWESA